MTAMADNGNTREAARVREKSEFIRCVHDFARYMQKEYIDVSDGRSLLITACDRDIDGCTKGGMAHIILGNAMLNTAAIASMMREESMADMFRTARIANTEDDMSVEIAAKRKRLRTLYVTSALIALWTLCLVGLLAWGVAGWVSTVTNMLLMGYMGYLIFGEIRPLRRQIARMKASDREERKARVKQEEDALEEFFGMLRRRMEQDGDDDE